MGWDIPQTIFLVLVDTQGLYFVPPLLICEVLNQCIKIKSSGKKVFDLNTNLLCPREESLQFFFSKIYLFQTFYSNIYPQNVQFFLYANSSGFQSNFFYLFTFVKILTQSHAQDFSNKKNRSFLRLLWAQIFLRQFTKFWHKRAILCAPTVVYAIQYQYKAFRIYNRPSNFYAMWR